MSNKVIWGIRSPAAVLDEVTWTAIDASAPEAEGHVNYPHVYDYETGGYFYEEDFPASIPLGHMICVGAQGINDSDYTLIFTLTIALIDPDGDIRGESSRSLELPPGTSIGHITDDVELDKEGHWQIYAKLESP